MSRGLHLGVNDVPRWTQALLFGFQQAMVCISGLLVYPILLSDAVCAGDATVSLRVQLIAATFVACGVATILQTTFGLRLPILHGPSIAFLPPLLVYKSRMSCSYGESDFVDPEIWQGRLREIAGSLLLACFSFVIVGGTGLAGLLSRLIGPVTVTPLMLLLCVSIMPTMEEKLSVHWISIVMLLSVCIMAVYLEEVVVRFPGCRRGIRLFGQFPYLLSIAWVWLLCHILTITNAEPEGSPIRTDRNHTVTVLRESDWFSAPYPGQFGMPSLNCGLCIGYLASCLAAVVENLGNYGLLARVAHQRPPPQDAVNRGIITEGLGSMLAAAMGVGTAVTTYSENIALIHVTRVASRRTMQVAGVLLLFLGVFTKCAAVLASIPEAIVGGMLTMGVSMIAGVTLSNLQLVDLHLSRNLSIMGMAVMLGLVVPRHIERNPLRTGNIDVDDVLNMLLSIKMLVGGLIAAVLDNTVPGATPAQRGIPTCEKEEESLFDPQEDAYSFHGKTRRFLLALPFSSWMPFLPKNLDESRLPSSQLSSTSTNSL